MHDVELLFGLFELTFEAGDLLGTGCLVLFQLGLQHRELLHCPFDSMFVLAEHHLAGSIFAF